MIIKTKHYTTTDKPPLGPVPEFIHTEKRIYELSTSISEYISSGYIPKLEWVDELKRLVEQVYEKEPCW
jgi:hypothetical protein